MGNVSSASGVASPCGGNASVGGTPVSGRGEAWVSSGGVMVEAGDAEGIRLSVEVAVGGREAVDASAGVYVGCKVSVGLGVAVGFTEGAGVGTKVGMGVVAIGLGVLVGVGVGVGGGGVTSTGANTMSLLS